MPPEDGIERQTQLSRMWCALGITGLNVKAMESCAAVLGQRQDDSQKLKAKLSLVEHTFNPSTEAKSRR